MRENDILKGEQGVLKRALYKSMRFAGEQLGKPITAIASSYTNVTPRRFILEQLCENVKEGIIKAGGTPMEFSMVAPCDSIAEGHEGICYILPVRDLVALSTECMVRVHRSDGLVLLGSCGRIAPGTLITVARLEMPATSLNEGFAYPASYRGRHYDGNIVTEAIGWKQQGRIDEEEFRHIKDIAGPCPGSCAVLETINTTSALSKSPGVPLMGSSTILVVLVTHMAKGVKTGEEIIEPVQKGVTTKDVLTEKAFENAVIHLLTMNGSTNGILHLQVIYYEARLGELPLSVLDELSRRIPQVAPIHPAPELDIVDLYGGGGVPAVLKETEEYLHKDIPMISGFAMGGVLLRFFYTNNRSMVKVAEGPFASTGGVAILKENIASLGCVIEPVAVPKYMFRYSGRTQIFTTEEGSCQAILEGRVRPGTCMVLMCEGLKDGSGMPEAYKIVKYLEGAGLSDTCASIMDERFSGPNRGSLVGRILPGAYEQGDFALIRDGDVIEIDVDAKSIEFKVPGEILKERGKRFVPVEEEIKRGYPRTYRRISASASKGVVVE